MTNPPPPTGIDWEDAFNNSDHIPGGDAFPAIWEQRSRGFRADCPHLEEDIAYGDAPRERLDLFHPSGPAKGLVVFVHGGYWMKMDKSLWSDLAAGPLAHGWAVAMPSYTLAPEARIARITQQISAAVTTASGLVKGPIRLTGHSAGGHLVTRMVCADSPLPGDVRDRLASVVSISGVHDLRPLRRHSMNGVLGLDASEAEAESPVLKAPLPGIPVTCWTGALERPEFLRQAQILTEAWADKTEMRPTVFEPDRHHFNVIEGLKDPDHAVTAAVLA